MRVRSRALLAVGILLVLAALALAFLFVPWPAPDLPEAPEGGPKLALEPWWDGFEAPVALAHDGDQMFVVEQAGRIVEAASGRTVVDLTDRVVSGGERGLLGLAFDPQEPDRMFVHYTDPDTVLARLDLVDGAWDGEVHEIWGVGQPYGNHNGGMLAFGPDGMLYLALGDGGLAGDPHRNGQDPSTPLGAILRIDVSDGTARAPPDNPAEHPFVWAHGLRNPWRFSFDSGDLWIGDVGQDRVEEVDVLRAPAEGEAGGRGANLGWNVWEGSSRFRPGSAPGHVPPVAEYALRDGRCAVVGGHVLRAPGANATYLFGDHCSGEVWSLDAEDPEGSMRKALDTDLRITAFGKGPDGVYVLDHGGRVMRVVGE